MARRRSPSSNPFTIWSAGFGQAMAYGRNMVLLSELTTASLVTVTSRLFSMTPMGYNTRGSGTAENERMVTEKLSALSEASIATMDWQRRAMIDGWSFLLKMNPMKADSYLPAFTTAFQNLAESNLRGGRDVLQPYHRRSTANAKRLTRTKKGS